MKRESPDPSKSEPPRKKALSIDPSGRPRFKGCETIKAYEMLGKLGEGTFGEVHKARHKADGKMVALKKILMHNAKEEGFPITALREIKILKMLNHKNIIRLIEMAVERKSSMPFIRLRTMYMITPYMEHDLAGLLENKDVVFSDGLVKCYLLQLLEGTKYLHENHILHRDMKAANLLIDNRGVLRIADFGLARIFDEPVPVAGGGGGQAKRDYTNCVVTRWYRPPELLLGEKRYTSAIDLWGVGCVFAEMYKRKPILQGSSDLDQMYKIFGLCGPPNSKTMPGAERLPMFEAVKNMTFQRTLESQHSRMGSSGVALLGEFLKLDPAKRINAIDALKHEYFKADPPPLKPGDVPKFNDSHELDGKKNRNRGPPPAPAGGSVGVGQNGGPEWAGRAGEVGPWGNGGATGNGGGGGGRRPPSDWTNGSGRQHSGRHHDRLPPHESSRVPLVHRERGGGDHRPPWAKSANPDHPHPRDAGLPPPPPPPRSLTGPPDRDRDRRPPGRSRGGGGGGAADRDTYIPSYREGDDDRRSNRGWDRDRGASRDRERSDWGDRGLARDRMDRGGDRLDRGERGDRERGDRGDRGDRGYGGGGVHSSQSRDRGDREPPAHNIYRR
ncbi:Pkinase-domain-containing protein [Wilcoxina mikolae CBS 423.85]|nr:Pkinase-domain-containing protein [Wilcoxina mikolae CBS 423.85]